MAYLTADRLGTVKAHPSPLKEGFEIGPNQTIYAHSLCFVSADDGRLYNLREAVQNGVPVAGVFYTDERLSTDLPTPRSHLGGVYDPSFTVLYGCDVYLDADGLSAGDEGKTAYAVDDHTITATAPSTNAVAVGTIRKVVDSTYALVHVRGTNS